MDINPVDNPELFSTESRASVVIGAAVFLMTTMTITVALRFYTRHFIMHWVGTDDWLSLGALIFALATGITQCCMTRQGLGHHIGTLPQPGGFKNYMQNFYLAIVWYNASLLLVKLTFLTQYWRVLATAKMRRICVGAMVLIGSWSLSQLMVEVFSCNPIEGFWDFSVAAFCLPLLPQWYTNAAGNVVTDVVIFILPLPTLGKLKLPRTQKFILIGIFCLGFFTCAISIIRIQYLHLSIDSTYENVDASLWSLCEVCSGTTCACLPTLRPLASRWISGLSTKTRRARGYTRQGNDFDTHRTNLMRDLDLESQNTPPIPPTSSNGDNIDGQAGYQLQRLSSGDSSDSIIGPKDIRDEMTKMDADRDPQVPKSVRVAPGPDWEQHSVFTRIESVGVRSKPVWCDPGPAIRVNRDIIVQSSRLPKSMG